MKSFESIEPLPANCRSERIFQLCDFGPLKPAPFPQEPSQITLPDDKLSHRMIFVQLGDEAISRYTDENQLAKLESLSKQFLVTNV